MKQGRRTSVVPRRAALRAGLLGALVAALAGCGQKGPLTLPAPPAAASAPASR